MEPQEPQAETVELAVFDVYRALHGKLGSEDKVLEKYPGLNREDLAAVEAYVIGSIRSRTRDEITGRPTLPKSELRDGAYYKGRCGNATVARWNDAEQRFYHWREKFGNIYIETIKYPTDEDEPWWDVFFVVEELEAVKFEIAFDHDATFEGDPSDLDEFQDEMWRRSNKHREDLKRLLKGQARSDAMTIGELRQRLAFEDERHAHDRWIRRLRRTWPEGVAARQPEPGETADSGAVEPWPETWRDPEGRPDPEGMCMQCLHCRYYVELSGELGADWGACTNELSQYDGQLVFEHWTCREWAEEIESPEEDQEMGT